MRRTKKEEVLMEHNKDNARSITLAEGVYPPLPKCRHGPSRVWKELGHHAEEAHAQTLKFCSMIPENHALKFTSHWKMSLWLFCHNCDGPGGPYHGGPSAPMRPAAAFPTFLLHSWGQNSKLHHAQHSNSWKKDVRRTRKIHLGFLVY